MLHDTLLHDTLLHDTAETTVQQDSTCRVTLHLIVETGFGEFEDASRLARLS